MKYFNIRGQILRGKHQGLYFTQLSEGYKAWSIQNLEGFSDELASLEAGKIHSPKSLEKFEDSEIRGIRSSSSKGGTKNAGIIKPGQKKFTSRAVRPKNY